MCGGVQGFKLFKDFKPNEFETKLYLYMCSGHENCYLCYLVRKSLRRNEMILNTHLFQIFKEHSLRLLDKNNYKAGLYLFKNNITNGCFMRDEVYIRQEFPKAIYAEYLSNELAIAFNNIAVVSQKLQNQIDFGRINASRNTKYLI